MITAIHGGLSMGKQFRFERRWSILTLIIVSTQLLAACTPAAQAPAPTTAPATTASAQKPASAQPAASSDSAGWQAEWDRTLAAARQEKLVVVTQPSSLEKEVIADFQKAFPDIP